MAQGDDRHITPDTITRAEFAALMQLMRANQMTLERQSILLEGQGRQIESMYKTLIGNGDQGSVVARLLLSEQKQKTAEEERRALSERLATMQQCIETIEEKQADDHNQIGAIAKEQKEMAEVQDKIAADVSEMAKTIAAWKHRGLGFIAGISAATTGLIAGIAKIVETIVN